MVDKAQDAYALVPRLKAADLDLIFCDMLTYATSASFGAIIRNLDVPIVLVALQPLAAMDYAQGDHAHATGQRRLLLGARVPGVAIRMGKRPPRGDPRHARDDPAAEPRSPNGATSPWRCTTSSAPASAISAIPSSTCSTCRPTRPRSPPPSAATSSRPRPTTCCAQPRSATTKSKRKCAEILEPVRHARPRRRSRHTKLTGEHLRSAALRRRGARPLRRPSRTGRAGLLLRRRSRQPAAALVTNLIVGNSLLTAAGFPMCGESDLKTCIAMLMMDRLDIGGSFAEFHPVDFREGFVLVGHDGPHHINIADGKPVLRSAAEVSRQARQRRQRRVPRSRTGPITMLSIGVKADGRFKFVLAEGESVRGPIPATGNTNTRGFFGRTSARS
jgi:L-arabinose isomerase